MPGRPPLSEEHRRRLAAVERALQASDVAEAVKLAQAALKDGLVHPLLLNLRALAFEREGREQEALNDLLTARSLAPDDAAIHNAIGLSYARQSRFLDAAKAFDAAAKHKPDFAHAHFNHGWALETLGELNAAQESYLRALALEPQRPETLARLASLAARKGDWAATEDFAARALAIDTRQNDAILARVTADIAKKRYAAAQAALDGLLSDGGTNADTRYHAYGALGDLYDRQARYADAFAAYIKGNEEMAAFAAPRFGAGRSMRPVTQWLTDWFQNSGEWAKTVPEPPRLAGDPRRHIFLLGFPRSGTTVLEQVLASHPDAVVLDEKEALGDGARAFMAAPEALSGLRDLDSAQVQYYRTLYWQRVREHGMDDTAGRIFIDKHPLHTLKMPLIARLFPEAKIIFAIRDPRDVLLSCLRRRFRMNAYMIELLRLDSAATFYSAYMDAAVLLREKLPVSVLNIRNEDVIGDFDSEIRRLCDFLGIEWHGRMQHFEDRARERAIATPGATQIMQGLNSDSVGQWRHYRMQLAPVLPVLQRWVERFGYTAD